MWLGCVGCWGVLGVVGCWPAVVLVVGWVCVWGVGLAEAAGGVGARVLAANEVLWVDGVGDGEAGVGPDLTSVSVSNDDAGVLTVRVGVPSEPVLREGLLVAGVF